VDDETLMRRAISIARANRRAPFGAIVVDKTGQVIGEGTDASDIDPTTHDVTAAIRASLQRMPRRTLVDCSVYATAEPCPMCASAIVWSGIRRVVYGTSARTLARMGLLGIHIGLHEVIDRSHRAGAIEVIGGVLENECDNLYPASPEGGRHGGVR
jgi:tRNA(adenine34) deaminase